MSTHRSSRILLGLVGAATAAALVVPGAAFAKGTPGGGGGGGGGEEETTTNSLSVPAIFVGSDPFALACGDATSPDGQTPTSNFTVPGYYYVQGVNTWQAECIEDAASATATAAWGDNLLGTAKKSVGSPIRVELGLEADPVMDLPEMTGWEVVKLEPSQLDRLSPYGTLATADGIGGFFSSPTTTLPTRVWAPGTLAIYLEGTTPSPMVATAEVNSTGRVVYGYNLRVTEPGTYVIEYRFDDVTFTGKNGGTISEDTHAVSLPIVVTAGGGGGGGKRP